MIGGISKAQGLVIFSISRFAMQNLKIISLFLFQSDYYNRGNIYNIAFCIAKHKNNEIIFIRVSVSIFKKAFIFVKVL